MSDAERLRIGDTATLKVRIRRTYVDADAARKDWDDGRRADVVTPGGKMVYGVAVAELEPLEVP